MISGGDSLGKRLRSAAHQPRPQRRSEQTPRKQSTDQDRKDVAEHVRIIQALERPEGLENHKLICLIARWRDKLRSTNGRPGSDL
jgi:hypothetical protein